MLAVEVGNVLVVGVLLAADADVNAVHVDGMTPLMFAVRYVEPDAIPYFGNARPDPRKEVGHAELALSLNSRKLAIARYLLGAGADVNAATTDELTPLMFAVASSLSWSTSACPQSNADFVRVLINAGADVTAVRGEGVRKLMSAPQYADHDVMRLFVDAGALSEAMERPTVNVGDSLAVAGASAAPRDRTPLLVEAAKKSRLDIVRDLVERGADVNVADDDGMTALMYAAKQVELELVEYLLDHGADVNLTNRFGQTAIYFAKRSSSGPIADHMLKRLKRAKNAPGLATAVQASTPCRTLPIWFIPPFEVALQTFRDTGNTDEEYRATWLDADVVVKLFIPGASGSTFAEEVTVWHQLRHPNVIKLYGACDVGLHFFVCELGTNGSLAEYLATRGDADSQPTPWKFLHEAALGLAYLHERKIFHGNLRCRNILVRADGLAKLANFELSGSTRSSTSGMFFKSTRWQSPERFKGEKASFASDIYSLGLCIFEAVVGMAPWARYGANLIPSAKELWDPSSQADENGPGLLTPEVHEVLAQMCSQGPHERVEASSAARLLERLTATEAAKRQLPQPEPEPLLSIDEFRNGELSAGRDDMRAAIAQRDRNDLQLHLFNELEALYERLEGPKHPWTLLESFHNLLGDFVGAIHAGSHQNRILRLSSTRAASNSMQAIRRRIEGMWDALGDHQRFGVGHRLQWEMHRAQQMEAFVSEVSETLLILNVDSEDDRIALLALLEGETKAHGSTYSETQLAVLRKACDNIALKVDLTELTTAPVWFLPWYELVVNNASCVGESGFGSVYRAKWLDSEVVIKQVKTLAASYMTDFAFDSMASSSASVAKVPAQTSGVKTQRQEMRRMFEREVGVWFGLSHPHVVRLFGACHVGVPFFACEYASNGSLDKYLRTHRRELWQKLYEASLGVQYLHARGIVHGDLKCNNIVVGSDGKAKVTDFGLSSEAALKGHHEVQLSGAWQWVAPECLEKGASQRSSASDVYALGMCIVEALWVVELIELEKDEREYYPTPWGNLDNASVKYHVVQMQKLPLRPELCSNDQWALMERMCANDPAKRMWISSVVGELARLAGVQQPNDTEKDVAPRPVSDVVAEMKLYINAPRDSRSSDAEALHRIYQLLWNRLDGLARLEDLASRITGDLDMVESLREVVERAASATMELHECPDTLIAFTVTALRGCALHRELDKLIDAEYWRLVGDGAGVHDWKPRCYKFLGVSGPR